MSKLFSPFFIGVNTYLFKMIKTCLRYLLSEQFVVKDSREGHTKEPLFSVQYHPEASPGPHDADYLFDDFISLVESR